MNTNKFFDGLALLAVLVVILGVGSAAISAFEAPINMSLKTSVSTSLNS